MSLEDWALSGEAPHRKRGKRGQNRVLLVVWAVHPLRDAPSSTQRRNAVASILVACGYNSAKAPLLVRSVATKMRSKHLGGTGGLLSTTLQQNQRAGNHNFSF